MGIHVIPLADLVVPNAVATSNALLATEGPVAPGMATGGGGFRDGDSVTIQAPAVLAEVATVQVALDSEVAPTWVNLQRGGADVTIAAAKAVTIEELAFRAIRISLSVVAAAQRTFKVNKAVPV